jgi:hypothetical protein
LAAEFILPYNNGKWSLIIEPNYQNFKTEKSKTTSEVSGGTLISKVNYKSFEIPFGVRYNYFLKNDSKIFLNSSLNLGISNSSIEFLRNDGSTINTLDINSSNNYVFGLGYKSKKKYNVEIQYQTYRELLGNYYEWNSRYNTVSLIFGINLL